jgi:5'-3' exonuclease
MNKKLTIFDADSMIFTVAWKFRDKNVKAMVTMHLNKFISDVITNSGATHYIGFFGSKEPGVKPNFRFTVDPNYKLNRPETPEWVTKWRPILFEAMKDKWKFMPVDGMEADDACAIAAKYFKNLKNPDGTYVYDEIIVAACDKDLRQIPGITYYNYQKHEKYLINTFDAAMNLGVQILMGDETDGVKGLGGVGPKIATRLLSECTTLAQIKWTIARMYKQKEDELRTKAEASIFAQTKAILLADTTRDFSGLSDKQIDRLVRIEAKKELAATLFDAMPGGWKAYLRIQYQLLTLLTESPDWFTLPEPVESTIVASLAQTVVDTTDSAPEVSKAKIVKPIDNFLYL